MARKEATLVLIKPDGLAKSLTGNVLTRLAEAKLEIAAAKCVRVSRRLAEEHYKSLRSKPFYSALIEYLMGKYHSRKKALALVYVGTGAIKRVRELSGATNPEEADPTTIRGQYGRITTKGVYENVLHASSDPVEAEREIKLWFQPEDIIFPLYPTKIVKQTKQAEIWA